MFFTRSDAALILGGLFNRLLGNSKVIMEDSARMLRAAGGDLAKQAQILDDFPTVRNWNSDYFNKAETGAFKAGKVQVHHIPPQKLLILLQDSDGLLLDLAETELPGHAMDAAAHQAMSNTMQSIINTTAFESMGPAAKVDRVIEFYLEYSVAQGATSEIGKACSNMAEILRAWGKVKGILP